MKLKDHFKVLIVDDSLLIQMLTGVMLENWGLEFNVCANGQLAVDNLKQESYDLILMDIMMPVMDGYHATEIIRGELLITTPIVAMTANSMDGEMKKCIAIGMTDFITKPIIETELFTILNKYITIKE